MTRQSCPPPFERGLRLAALLFEGKAITSRVIREEFGVAAATAKRDMLAIETTLRPDVDVGPYRWSQVTLRLPEWRR